MICVSSNSFFIKNNKRKKKTKKQKKEKIKIKLILLNLKYLNRSQFFFSLINKFIKLNIKK
jgi:hypothetical protein